MAKVGNDIVKGEEAIQTTKLNGSLEHLWIEPVARANPKALAAIRDADAIVIGPGGFYSSLVANLLVRDIPEAILKSSAKKIYVCNLMTKAEHTDGYSVADYTKTLEKYLGGSVDAVIYNNKAPRAEILKRYAREGDTLTSWDDLPEGRELIGGKFIAKADAKFQKIGTPAAEASLVRHDSAQLAAIIARMFNVRKRRESRGRERRKAGGA